MVLKQTADLYCWRLCLSSLFLALAGCLPSAEVDSTDTQQIANQQPGQNSPPRISGSPGSQAIPGQSYTFEPNVSDPDGDALTITVQGLPRWASFDSSDGTISGTPDNGDVAAYSGISITVSDGQSSTTLGPFTITVNSIALGSASLSWTPPTLNTDGSVLTDLAGYRIYYGPSSGSYSQSITVDNPGVTDLLVENLTAGNWYFVSTAYNAAGIESSYSGEALKIIQ
ncbi:MAG: putative Ig domain-containing protein [Woeseia sp.]